MLKGFDSYEVTLGDEMRGERASRGKSLLDVQRDLRIGAEYIAAIENADASAFPFSGFAAGYVRSYARYLGMNADEVYRRFCAESGFDASSGAPTPDGRMKQGEAPANRGAKTRRMTADAIDDKVISNRFTAANRKDEGLSIADGLRGLASVGMLAALVGGLGYGGWSMLQNLQRVGFAPLPTAPDVQVSAPDFFSPDTVSNARPAEGSEADEGRETLASIYAAQEAAPKVATPRDGPISSIDPARAGIYAPPVDAASRRAALPSSPARVIHDAGDVPGFGDVDPNLTIAVARLEQSVIPGASLPAGVPDAAGLSGDASTPVAETPKAPPGVHVLATDEAWVRIRDGSRRVLFSGTLGPGESFAIPEDASDADLRAGNAGAVYIVVNGEVFGPLGVGPSVAKNVSLAPADVRAAYPAAEGVAFATAKKPAAADLALHSE